jgi:Tfp pilus assembly protein FimT
MKRPADGFAFEQLVIVLAVAAIVYAIAALTMYFSG